MTLSNAAALAKDKRTSLSVEMQHRHFAAIAAIIRDLHENGTMTFSDAVVVQDHFADALAKTNPRFNRGRFMSACAGEA